MKKLLIICSVFVFCFVAAVEVNAQNRKAVSGAEVTGTFRETASGSEFKILALGKGKLRVDYLGFYWYKIARGEKMVNFGGASGEAVISGDTATFTPADTEQCTITLKFLTRGRLKVSQNGTPPECDFGHNVSAAGTYKKVSGKKPQFTAP